MIKQARHQPAARFGDFTRSDVIGVKSFIFPKHRIEISGIDPVADFADMIRGPLAPVHMIPPKKVPHIRGIFRDIIVDCFVICVKHALIFTDYFMEVRFPGMEVPVHGEMPCTKSVFRALQVEKTFLLRKSRVPFVPLFREYQAPAPAVRTNSH